MPAPSTTRHVALIYPVAVPWMALFVRGVHEYGQQQGGWSLTTCPPALSWAGEQPLTLESLLGWPGDGIIAGLLNQADLDAARRLGKPLVNMAASLKDSGFPTVSPDHVQMGRLAAEHLLDRGLQRLAFYGLEGRWFSVQRRRGFAQRAAEAGVPCEVLEVPASSDPAQTWSERTGPLTGWLQRLTPPVGLLAVQDYRARSVMDECQRLHLEVPHDVAVMGMEDDPTICEFSRPTLTSVSRNPWRMGYETAAMLDRLMQGLELPAREVLVPPDGVVARQSTDTVAVEDRYVAAAVHFIHDHLGEPLNVQRVVRATGISRRQLEVRFRRVLHATLYDYICRERIERAKRLLLTPDRPKLQSVAAACGFSNLERMRLTFKRATGQTPLAYRQAELANR